MFQKTISLKARPRGFHLITEEVVSQLHELQDVEQGVLHLFIQHTSASLTLNENADPDVRADMERYFLAAVADDTPYFAHTLEGGDDMPAHIKSALLPTHLSIPVLGGRMALGTWQGIYLFEHRDRPHTRCVVAHLQ